MKNVGLDCSVCLCAVLSSLSCDWKQFLIKVKQKLHKVELQVKVVKSAETRGYNNQFKHLLLW